MVVLKLEAPKNKVPQKKDWIQPDYNVVVKKTIDMDYIKELISNILPPASNAEDTAPMPPKPNVPTPPGVPPRHRLSDSRMDAVTPPPRPYVPTPPYEGLLDFNSVGVIPKPGPNVPLPPDTPPTQNFSGPTPTPRPNVPLPPDAPPTQ